MSTGKAESIIHSGQFMSSHVHESKLEEEEIDVVSDSSIEAPDIDLSDTKDDKPVTFYKFGPKTTRSIAIDTSLTKLNKCIQIVYQEGKLVTPKWKNFQSLKIGWKDRVRLNNVIWRAWHRQFVLNAPPKYCFYSVPEDGWHRKPEAVVVEGMYWKRRIETVATQYLHWRKYFLKHAMRKKIHKEGSQPDIKNQYDDHDTLLLSASNMTPLSVFEDDDLSNWFTDTLFSSLSHPYIFPNPKEMAQAGNADIIQPGLVQLQPSLEEIMASLEDDSPLTTEQSASTSTVADVEDKVDETTSFDKPSSSSQYTSKDYVAASLLIEYSSQAASQYDHPDVSPVVSGDTGYTTEPIYSRENLHSVTSNMNSFYEPYIPQMATISSVESQHLQYSIAKNWCSDSSLVMAHSCLGKSPEAQPLECVSHPDVDKNITPAVDKPLSFTSPKPTKDFAKEPKSTGKAWKTAKATAKADVAQSSASGNNRSVSLPCSNSHSIENSTAYYPSARERLCSVDARPTEQLEDASGLSLSTSAPVSPMYQQSAIVRPVPISLCRSDSRTFSAVSSPLFIPNAHIVVQSPLQASPGSATSDLTQSSYPSSPASSFLHLSPQLPSFLQNSPLSSQASLLIRPSFGSIQFPLVTYPSPVSANSSQSYAPFKQELPWTDTASASNLNVMDSNEIDVSEPKVKGELPTPIYGHDKTAAAAPQTSDSSTSKTIPATKRPADSTIDSGERKRVLHLQAEQSRRSALKMGFELLEDLVCDSLSKNAKPTNALVLARAVDQIRTLKSDCTSNDSLISIMKAEIDKINEKIASYQNHLNTSHGTAKITPFNEMVDNYFKLQLQKEWKLWPLYLLFQHLAETFSSDVNGQNIEELLVSAQEWAQKHCTRNAIRPVLSNLLVQLATDTPIFSDPQAFKLYVKKKIS